MHLTIPFATISQKLQSMGRDMKRTGLHQPQIIPSLLRALEAEGICAVTTSNPTISLVCGLTLPEGER